MRIKVKIFIGMRKIFVGRSSVTFINVNFVYFIYLISMSWNKPYNYGIWKVILFNFVILLFQFQVSNMHVRIRYKDGAFLPNWSGEQNMEDFIQYDLKVIFFKSPRKLYSIIGGSRAMKFDSFLQANILARH